MEIKAVIASQYLATLEMMKQAISQCPDELWSNMSHTNQFWHIAYHALFYTHLYLQPTEADFAPWAKSHADLNDMGRPYEGKPLSKADILEYLAFCQQEVQKQTANLEPTEPSGFSWIPLNKLELQFYNIRHLQLHVGELAERLWAEAELEVGWVGLGHAPQ